MVGEMKFEESSLTRYLVKNLKPLTEADPVILAEYVAALLKKEKPINELQKLCAEKLVEFLGEDTNTFITKLFQALDDCSFELPAKSLGATEQVELSSYIIGENKQDDVKHSALKPEVPDCSSDPEEKEVSDDDDDDRNHKHRRRETRSQSLDKDAQGEVNRRINRKRNKPSENGQAFFRNDPQSSESQKEYNPACLERDLSGRIDKRRPGLAPFPRTTYDTGLRSKGSQAFHGDPGAHFDLSSTLGRLPTGRGRGRGSGSWNPHDLKFSSYDTLDYASQMPPQGPTPTSIFAGRGLQQFGMIPGMPNGALDTLHPLGLQGALGPQQSMNIGLPRQRCRDFEERGFCLRGDMCPMEHGVNRIVVEDVQSLSQFNLPVSLPSAHLMGTASGAGSLHLGSGPSNLQTNNKSTHNKNSKHGVGDDGFGLNKMPSSSAGAGEADFYDPDQPLWSNDHLSSPKVDDSEPVWNGDQASAIASQSTNSSVWGRIRKSGNKTDAAGNFGSTLASAGGLRNGASNQEEVLSNVRGTTHQKKRFASNDPGPKSLSSAADLKPRIEPVRKNGRTFQKALRTLFVNGIPLKNNKKEALLSHFRKFGQIIDIYIPLNSEKAFVQFSKREEAEAAYMAPDAVMGNRFIKLWWANRDSIPDNGLSISDSVSAAPQGVEASSLPLPDAVDRRKESPSPAAPKPSPPPLSDVPVSAGVVFPPAMNGLKVALPPKKLDNLELLKEEIRLKQEMLDKKRNDFRRQLEKLEKQAIPTKSEATAGQAAKRHKVGMGTELAETAISSPSSSLVAGFRTGSEKKVERTHSGESNVSPSSKTSSTLLLSPRSLKHLVRPSMPLGGGPVANRFKLDNRPTRFRILPPLPPDFANVTVMKEHFSNYGDISVLELEDLEAYSGDDCSGQSGNLSAVIAYTTRRSSEMAFANGKCWKGHNLKFSWVVGHSNSTNSHSGKENSPTSNPKGTPDTELLTETAMGDSTSSVSKVAARNEELEESSKGKNDTTEPMDLLSHSGETPLLSSHTPSKEDTPIDEDGVDAETEQ